MKKKKICSNLEGFRLDLADANLWYGNQRLHLRPKTFAVLQCLIENPGQLVKTDSIVAAVWPNVIVTDSALGVCISELRRTFGDTAKPPRWVETVHKRGYRFIGPLEIVRRNSGEGPIVVSETTPTSDANEKNGENAQNGTELSFRTASPESLPEGSESSDRAESFPTIWAIPHLRNPHFTGRERLLTGIRETLTSGKRTTLTQTISGLGGVGKTQLAAEYAYRYARWYEAVLWVSGDSSAALAAQYIRLAQDLALPGAESGNYNALAAAVRRWFEQHSNWLVVFDNVDEPDLIRPYLPRAKTGHVLITSRNPNWSGLANVLAVSTLERSEAVAFLLRRTMQNDAQMAATLAETLGDLPLALEQAGAYIETAGITLAGYQRRFANSSHELLQQGRTATGYAASVATTWALAFQQTQQASSLAEPLLTLCAFLSADTISRDMLSEGLQLDTSESSVALDDAIATLRHHSLVDVGPTTLCVHRLVQAVTRQRLRPAERQAAIECAVRVIRNQLLRTESSRDWSTHARLLPHAMAVAHYAQELPATPAHWQLELGLVLMLGQLLTAVKGYAAPEVKTTFRRARTLARKVGCSESSLKALQGLAVYYLTRAELEKAQHVAEESVVMAQRLEDRTRWLYAQDHLGQIVLHRGDYPRAQTHFMVAMKHYEQQPENHAEPPYGAVGPVVACASYIGWCQWALGFPTQAIQQVRHALGLVQNLDHPLSLAFVLQCKCVLHQLRSEVDAARICAEEVNSVASNEGLAYWLSLGRIMLGWTLVAQGQHEAGITSLREGVAAFRARGATLTQPYVLGLLADAYDRCGQTNEALTVVDQALALADQTSERCNDSELHRHRGELLLQLSPDKRADAEVCVQRAITIARQQGAKSFELKAAVTLGRWWQQQDEHTKARDLLKPIYDSFTEGHDTIHLQEAKALLDGR